MFFSELPLNRDLFLYVKTLHAMLENTCQFYGE